jgi:two-component system phosphate regulon response regulator PhoB
MLEKQGHAVTEAFDGIEALRALGLDPATGAVAEERDLPDLIILDVMMPQADGYTVYSRLQANDRTRGMPVMILTAKGKTFDLFEDAAGVAAFMEKPFDPKALRQKIQEIVSATRGSGGPAPPASQAPPPIC